MTERLIRRTRAVARTARRPVDAHPSLEAIKEKMQTIAQNQAQLVALQDMNAALTAEVEQHMKEAGVAEYDHAGLLAHTVETKSNSSTEYDLAKLRKAVGEENFLKVVKAQAGAVKEFLSEREIASVSTTTPGKVTGSKFEIIVPKKTTGKGKK